MRRFVVPLIAALALAGCQTVAERRAAEDREDDARCRSYGAKPGTAAYRECRLERDRIRVLEAEARRPVVVGVGPVWGFGFGVYCRHTPWGVRCY